MIIAHYNELMIPGSINSLHWQKALEWLSKDRWREIPLGQTEIDGNNVFAKRSAYLGKSECERRYEMHRVYADIQMPIQGSELQLFCFEDGFKDGLKTAVPYSQERDIEFFEGEPEIANRIILTFPMVAVFFPWDIHKTCVSPDGSPTEIDKIIVKVLMERA